MNKAQLAEVAGELPEEFDFDDLFDKLMEKSYGKRKELTHREIEESIDRGLKEADEGKGIPSEEMWKEMRKW